MVASSPPGVRTRVVGRPRRVGCRRGRRLWAAASRIGRDHIASTVNTLVLAYTAAALPLLLLYTQSGLSFRDVLTNETIAVEVVQTLVGSIGLVASVPITTALACWVVGRTAGSETNGDQGPPRRRRRPTGPEPMRPPDFADDWPFLQPQAPPHPPDHRM